MKQSISPYQQTGRKSWVCTFTGPDGKRVTRGLGTSVRGVAKMLCIELERLSEVAPPRQDAAAAASFSPTAWRIWFGEDPPPQGALRPKDAEALRTQILGLSSELVSARAEIERLKPFEGMYHALAQSIEGRRHLAAERSPTLAEVREPYFLDLAGLARGGTFHRTWFNRFSEFIGEDVRVAEIRPGRIADFLRQDAAKAEDPNRAKRMRTIISRFYSWCALHHGIASPLDQVPTPKSRAEHDIQWHSLEEVDAALASLPPYWRAMAACMAFAGLSAHEVRGLRREDLVQGRNGLSLRVAPTDERGLKTAKRRRSVAVSKRLAPILKAHLATLDADAPSLFPPLIGKAQIWNPHTLSHEIGKILPEGMDCLSLRRTFGSLLIRSGKSAEEVAAAMGNSAAMVTRHYGRILGGEVDIDF